MKDKKINKIVSEATIRNIQGYGYNASVRKIIWMNKKCSWNHISISYGIRNSEIKQIFPIWNMSNNNSRALMFGFNFCFFLIDYHRKKSFKQKRFLPFRKNRTIWKLYQLFI